MLRLVAGLGAVVALSGCTVPVVGMAGVGVDHNGQPVGYLSVCEDHIDGATLYMDFAGPDRSVDAGVWETTTPVTGSARWSLTNPSDGWKGSTQLTDLQPGREYTLYGWTDDNSAATTGVTFTLEELKRLKPGTVLHFSGESDKESGRDRNASDPERDFRTIACGR